jgi:heme exporter protein B
VKLETPTFFSQLNLIIKHGIKVELADKERLISPIIFAATILMLFNFAMGGTPPSMRHQIFTAETFLTGFLALQLCFMRIFEPDQEDRIFELMQTYPVNATAWYLGKYALVLILSTLIMIPTTLMSALLLFDPNGPLLSVFFYAVVGLSLIGMGAIGVLLSTITLKARARQILFPILYFPLTTPIILAAVNSTLLYLEKREINEAIQGWIGLLCLFDVIYLTLGILLFSEIVEESE